MASGTEELILELFLISVSGNANRDISLVSVTLKRVALDSGRPWSPDLHRRPSAVNSNVPAGLPSSIFYP